MKILFITRLFYPHIGGVEKHVLEVGKSLIKMGHDVTVITEKYDKEIKSTEKVEGIKVIRFSYRKVKFLGLVGIWCWLFKNRKLIEIADIVHCHDVFIWYLPLRFIYPKKRIFTTVHGLEWDRPLSFVSICQKRLAVKLSTASVGVGKFLEKYLNVRFDLVIYGAAKKINLKLSKNHKKIVYVGRLEKNTGLLKFLDWLDINRDYKIDFCGDGNLRSECERFGIVHGFINPTKYYKRARYCIPGGYLAALEALNAGCEIKLFWNNKVKEDYWKMSPFYKLKGADLLRWSGAQTWEKIADEYLSLYKSVLK